MVTIATFNEPAKARQLKQRFQDAGLKADVHNEAPLQEFGFMSSRRRTRKSWWTTTISRRRKAS